MAINVELFVLNVSFTLVGPDLWPEASRLVSREPEMPSESDPELRELAVCGNPSCDGSCGTCQEYSDGSSDGVALSATPELDPARTATVAHVQCHQHGGHCAGCPVTCPLVKQ